MASTPPHPIPNPRRSRRLGATMLAVGLLVLGGCGSTAPQNSSPQSSQAAKAVAPLKLQRYARVLERTVDRDGLVDYKSLQREPGDLEATVKELGAVPQASFNSWREEEQIAFLINAYNALTLASIIKNDPIKPSIRDIWGVWKLNMHQVAGEAMTLDHIEHGILRKRYDEPRIHAALVCAAVSCPPLRQEPYTGGQLDRQLDDQTRLWLASPQGLVIDRATNTVAISAIFQWFGEDWKRRYATDHSFGRHGKQREVLNFISSYAPASEKEFLRKGDYNLVTLNYNWLLNSQ